ncbi:MAG: nucleoside/nucleotide kinase family protein [Oscillospiraceae bacterium]|nr:nucleoside/nucleotide kinase family protein [Oscillospiraceae bacterium]
MEYSAKINGIDVTAQYSEQSIRDLLIPLLERLSALQAEKGSRILVLLAAPPGAGKSTLVSFLEYLAKDALPGQKLQAVGMDGFHRRQEYLLSHTFPVDGKEIPMVKIKGAPATFDLESLQRKLAELTQGGVCTWPRYDRLLHNPVEDAVAIDADIVLLEGNYLLLDLDGWRDLAAYADYTISLTADEGLLRERLIARRIATGVRREDAVSFVDFSDMANVRLCLEKTGKADLELVISQDGGIFRRSGEKPPRHTMKGDKA